jgi:hypothetical protein
MPIVVGDIENVSWSAHHLLAKLPRWMRSVVNYVEELIPRLAVPGP